MVEYESKTFGKFDLENLEYCYFYKHNYEGRELKIDLNFGGPNILATKAFEKVDDFIENLNIKDKFLKEVIFKDFLSKGVSYSFIKLHQEYLDKEVIEKITKSCDSRLPKEFQILSKMYLSRIGFYPQEDEDVFSIFDYAIAENYTNDLLVVFFNEDTNFRITVES